MLISSPGSRGSFRMALLAVVVLVSVSVPRASAALRSPEEFLGHPVGQDRQLMGWDTILGYLDELDSLSDRMELIELGRTTEGRRFVIALVADEEGIRGSDGYRDQVAELYDVRATGEERAREIAAGGRPIVAFSLGVHSTEVAASQASMEMLYRLVTSEDETTRRIRGELLVLVVPSMNPDGLDLVQQWYMQTVGTEAEGTRPLELYHPWAGHDNNRDGFFNNLVETSMWSQVLYHDWLPQMVVDEHQMGNSGPRLFLPPFDDPISPTVHPLVYSQISAAGQQAVSDLTAGGWQGIVTSTVFTGEWPGSVRSTGFWHNMLGVLSEVASARLATPLYFPGGSLSARGRGLDAWERRANFLEPWPGGWWRLRDIIDLDLDLTWSLLRWASDHSSDLLLNFWRMNRDAVQAGGSRAPFAFVIPANQIDGGSALRLARILRSGGVELHRAANELQFGDQHAAEGSWVIRADQPFRPFVVEMLGSPAYPEIREQGEVVRPYDVTAWKLGELLGVRVLEVDSAEDLAGFNLVRVAEPVAAEPAEIESPQVVLPVQDLASFTAANRALAAGQVVRRTGRGDFVVEGEPSALSDLCRASGARPAERNSREGAVVVRRPRIGIYSPWGGSMDEGWTRLVLKRHGFSFERMRPGQPELLSAHDGRRLREHRDVVLLPSIDAGVMAEGQQGMASPRVGEAVWPEEYRRGIGEGAGAALRAFVEAGGRVVAISESTPWVIDALGLPVEAVGGGEGDAWAPGTLLRAELDPGSDLAVGMGNSASVYFANGYAFRPRAWPRPAVVHARYAREDLLVAGFLKGGKALQGQPAILEVPLGRGSVVLFGFHPQRRAQTEGTFKLLFNALWPAP